MKKLALTILGLFTLIACSDEVYQEIADNQNSGNVENTPENPENTVFTVDPATGYESPYDNNVCCSMVAYSFENLTTDLNLEFFPYVGLARFDGAYDAMHFAWPINSTLYPNVLAPPENHEYFKLVKCNPFYIPAGGADNFAYSAQLPIAPGDPFTITPPTSPTEWTIL